MGRPTVLVDSDLRSHLRALLRSLALVRRAAPRELRRLVLLNLAFGAGPAVVLYLGKLVIDEVARLLEEGSSSGALTQILNSPVLVWSIVAFVAINILLDSVETLAALEISSLRDRLRGSVQSLIYGKVANFEDIALFEDPKYLNILQLAEQSIPKMQRFALTIGNLLTGLFVLMPVLVLSFTIAWWVPLVIFLSAVPSIWVQLRYEQLGWSIESEQAGTARQMDLHGKVLTAPEYAKDLRMYRLQPLLLGRWRSLFSSTFDRMQQVRRRGAWVVIAWSLLSGLGAGLPYFYVVAFALNGGYTLGTLALYAGLVFEVRRSLFVLVGNAADLQDIAYGSTAIYRLLELEPKIRQLDSEEVPQTSSVVPANVVPAKGIGVRSVSFSYPGNDIKVLEDIDLAIRPGEMIVIVGENGAGKTTLAKLLCRLYDPEEGCISWNGTDIRAIEPGAWRENVAVVNQDYARFPASARENIGYGDVGGMDDDGRVLDAAEGAGLRSTIENLPHGLDTPLSKQLENGVEPSGGQWQRFAIARALMRRPHSEVIILDEPTSALDAKAEHEIFEILRAMARKKIAVVISHRLALARTAHKIVVMERGRVVESGTHAELMAKEGLYRTMFVRQASSYTEDTEEGARVGR